MQKLSESIIANNDLDQINEKNCDNNIDLGKYAINELKIILNNKINLYNDKIKNFETTTIKKLDSFIDKFNYNIDNFKHIDFPLVN